VAPASDLPHLTLSSLSHTHAKVAIETHAAPTHTHTDSGKKHEEQAVGRSSEESNNIAGSQHPTKQKMDNFKFSSCFLQSCVASGWIDVGKDNGKAGWERREFVVFIFVCVVFLCRQLHGGERAMILRDRCLERARRRNAVCLQI